MKLGFTTADGCGWAICPIRISPPYSVTMAMDADQVRAAAEAAETRRIELGRPKTQLGADAKTWNEFIAGRWPFGRTRGRIEQALSLRPGALERIARGTSTLTDEAVKPDAPQDSEVPPQIAQIRTVLAELEQHYRLGDAAMVQLKTELLANLLGQLPQVHSDGDYEATG